MTSITRQRELEEAQELDLRRRFEWECRFDYVEPKGDGPWPGDDKEVIEPADALYAHISVTNPGNYSSNDAHARGLEAIGMVRFPNTGVSYNAGVMPNGAGYEFQPIGRRGAHTVNDKNLSSCVTSGCPSRGAAINDPRNNLNYNVRAVVVCQNVDDTVTRKQIDTMARIGAAWKRAGLVKRNARWHGHRCVAWKDCPGAKVWAWMDELERLTEFYTVNGLEDEMTEEEHKLLVEAHRVLTDKIDRVASTVEDDPPISLRAMIRYTHGWTVRNNAQLDQQRVQIANLAAGQAAMSNLLEQILAGAGQPVDMAAVQAAANAGASEALAALDATVTLELEPDVDA